MQVRRKPAEDAEVQRIDGQDDPFASTHEVRAGGPWWVSKELARKNEFAVGARRLNLIDGPVAETEGFEPSVP